MHRPVVERVGHRITETGRRDAGPADLNRHGARVVDVEPGCRGGRREHGEAIVAGIEEEWFRPGEFRHPDVFAKRAPQPGPATVGVGDDDLRRRGGQRCTEFVVHRQVGTEHHRALEIQRPRRCGINESLAVADHDQHRLARAQANHVERIGNGIGGHRRRVGQRRVDRQRDLIEEGLFGSGDIRRRFAEADRLAKARNRFEKVRHRYGSRGPEPLVGQIGSVHEITDRHELCNRHDRSGFEAALLKTPVEGREEIG